MVRIAQLVIVIEVILSVEVASETQNKVLQSISGHLSVEQERALGKQLPLSLE